MNPLFWGDVSANSLIFVAFCFSGEEGHAKHNYFVCITLVGLKRLRFDAVASLGGLKWLGFDTVASFDIRS